MIQLVMSSLEILVYGLIGFTVIYMILKAMSMQSSTTRPNMQVRQTRVIDVEITSRDLYMKAENLIQTHDVLAFQTTQIQHEIDTIEDLLAKEQNSPIKSESEIKSLISQSLRLQEKKCNIEGRMIKIMSDIDKLAKEELKRRSNKI